MLSNFSRFHDYRAYATVTTHIRHNKCSSELLTGKILKKLIKYDILKWIIELKYTHH